MTRASPGVRSVSASKQVAGFVAKFDRGVESVSAKQRPRRRTSGSKARPHSS